MSENLPQHVDVEPVIIDELVELEKQSEIMKKMIHFALEQTSEHDWVLMRGAQGRDPIPYLQAPGVEKMGKLFGVNLRNLKKEKIAKEGGHYRYRMEAEFFTRTRSITAFGSRDSDDPFFATAYRRNPETGQNEKYTKEAREVAEGDVELAAYSNMFCNGVKRLVGLRGLTLEQLKKAGLRPEKMAGIQYRESVGSSAHRAKEEAGDAAEAAADVKKEESYKKRLYDLVAKLAGPDPAKQADFLEKITEFTNKDSGESVPGVRSFKALADKRALVTFKRLEKDVADGRYKPFVAGPAAEREPGQEG